MVMLLELARWYLNSSYLSKFSPVAHRYTRAADSPSLFTWTLIRLRYGRFRNGGGWSAVGFMHRARGVKSLLPVLLYFTKFAKIHRKLSLAIFSSY